jgi:hypothetical protein
MIDWKEIPPAYWWCNRHRCLMDKCDCVITPPPTIRVRTDLRRSPLPVIGSTDSEVSVTNRNRNPQGESK